MEPTLTSAATAAYLTQQAPALAAFLATPQGMIVAASLGIVALSMDQIKENLTLLGQLYQVYVMLLRDEIGIDTAGGLYNTKSGDQVNQSTLFNTQSSSSAAGGGMFDPDEDPEKKNTSKPEDNWNSWEKLPKVTHDGKVYAKIGNRLYTPHAIARMQPSGLGTSAGHIGGGRSVAPKFVEDVIKTGVRRIEISEKGIEQSVVRSGNLEVITEQADRIIVTVKHIGKI